MKLKLTGISLFLIVLISLVLGMLTSNVVEGLTNESESQKKTAMAVNPKGIHKSQIPNGEEDLYILKSEIVPPVCPACPPVLACPKDTKCPKCPAPEPIPPCPPCERCPEPSFKCKKVPDYQSPGLIPRPLLNDFSQFT